MTSQGQGRISNPETSLETDPRAHPKLIAALQPAGLAANLPPLPEGLDPSAPLDAIAQYYAQIEPLMPTIFGNVPQDLPSDTAFSSLKRSEEFTTAPDGHKIKLTIYSPANQSGPLPAVIYLHGGGMTVLKTELPHHIRWVQSLAATGTIAVLVDFRNAWSEEYGWNPFPTGLNDCAAAVKWVDEHRKEFNISKLILNGESGGGNLVTATALKANKEGWTHTIDGVYACCPMISGGYSWDREMKLKTYPSLVECDGYIISCASMAMMAKTYDPEDKYADDPLAFPLRAKEEDLKGLPPHVLAMDELDPLRDEGIAYWRKLAAAGVKVMGRVNLGVVHGFEMIFRGVLPEASLETIWDVKRFAQSL